MKRHFWSSQALFAEFGGQNFVCQSLADVFMHYAPGVGMATHQLEEKAQFERFMPFEHFWSATC